MLAPIKSRFHTTIADIAVDMANLIRPPRRLKVSETAERYRVLSQSGTIKGPWKNATTPYMVEVMDTFKSPYHRRVVMMGPVQSGKSEAGLNLYLHNVICDPLDMMIVEKDQDSVSELSKGKLEWMHDGCPELRALLRPGEGNNNIKLKRYLHGTSCALRTPTKNTFAGRTMPCVIMPDYDRYPQDAGLEGSPAILGFNRMSIFPTAIAMQYIDSTPSMPVLDPSWSRSSPHDAPPSEGVMGLYRQGDRRCWYWQCVDCKKWFEPDLPLMRWLEGEKTDKNGKKTGEYYTIEESAQSCWMECPCGCQYRHNGDNGKPSKYEMNLNGRWVKDGQTLDTEGNLVGEPLVPGGITASFWLKGPAAGLTTWYNIMTLLLEAQEMFDHSGGQLENQLKSVINTNFGLYYIPQGQRTNLSAHELMNRAEKGEAKTIPAGVRFLIAAVDVQKNGFVVQVHGFGEGRDIWVIDRFPINFAKDRKDRTEGAKGDAPDRVAAHEFDEDWELLIDKVIKKEYPLEDDKDKVMEVMMTICDSGGTDGTTFAAYRFARLLQDGPTENHKNYESLKDADLEKYRGRFHLFKGDGIVRKDDVRSREIWPDRPDKRGQNPAAGGIQVISGYTNKLKDDLLNSIVHRTERKTGMLHFPYWLKLWWYEELVAETRDPKTNKWSKIRPRNESLDCLVMAYALATNVKLINLDKIDWMDSPYFAEPPDTNEYVRSISENKTLDKGGENDVDLEESLKGVN